MTNSSETDPVDPMAVLARTPSMPLRVAALLLAIGAQFLPALSNSFDAFGVGLLSQVAPLAIAFPVVIAILCILPAIPTAARYMRLGDILAAGVGAVSLAAVLSFYGSVQAYADKYNGDAFRDMSDPVMTITPGPATYLLGAATAVLLFLVFQSGRPSTTVMQHAPAAVRSGRQGMWFGIAGLILGLASVFVPLMAIPLATAAAASGGWGFWTGRREGSRAAIILGVIAAAVGALLLVLLVGRKIIFNL